jgi:hypothetical protein
MLWTDISRPQIALMQHITDIENDQAEELSDDTDEEDSEEEFDEIENVDYETINHTPLHYDSDASLYEETEDIDENM